MSGQPNERTVLSADVNGCADVSIFTSDGARGSREELTATCTAATSRDLPPLQVGDRFRVIIPEGATAVTAYAFDGCSRIVAVVIPKSVHTIETGAFSHCVHLTVIEGGEGVAHVEGYAFSKCSSLEVFEQSKRLVTLREAAFQNCTKLRSVPRTRLALSHGRLSRCVV